MEIPQAVISAVNEWFHGPYQEYKDTNGLEECSGEVVCSNVSELHPDPANIIIFMGINPGGDPETHGYTIEQNVNELNVVLPENRRWYNWETNYPAQITYILQCLYPDRFLNNDENRNKENRNESVLYFNRSFIRTRQAADVTPEHRIVSWHLVDNLLNLVQTPIFVFGRDAFENVADNLEMEVVAARHVGWGNVAMYLYRNHATNRKMVAMPHLGRYPWATRIEAQDDFWVVIRNFLDDGVIQEPQGELHVNADDEQPDIQRRNVPPPPQIAIGDYGEEIRSLRAEITSLRTEVQNLTSLIERLDWRL